MTLRFGILGTGPISHTMCNAISQSQDSELIAVAGRTQQNVHALAKAFSFKQIYHDYDELIKSPDINIVYIALPNHLHKTWIIKAAQAGKHILCEKTLTMNYQQASEALNIVKKNNVFLMEGLMYRCHPLINSVLEAIKKLGHIDFIHMHYHADIADVSNIDGGAAILNLGAYPISLLQLIMRAVYQIPITHHYQLFAKGNLCYQFIRDASCMLHFNTGTIATVSVSDHHPMHAFCEIIGDKGRLTMANNIWYPAHKKNAFTLALTKQPLKQYVVNSASNTYQYQINTIEKTIKKGLTEAPFPAPSWQDSLDIMHCLSLWRSYVLKQQEPHENLFFPTSEQKTFLERTH